MPRSAEANLAAREQSRARILDAASRLFADHGYEQTTLSAVAEEAGVATGLVSYYFAGKRGLLAAVLRPRIELFAAAVGRLPADPDAALGTVIDDFFAAVAKDPAGEALVVALVIHPATRALLAEAEDDLAAELLATEGALRDVFARRGADDPVLEEILLRTTLEGVVVKRAVYGDSFPLEAVQRRIRSAYGLATESAQPLPDSTRLRAATPV